MNQENKVWLKNKINTNMGLELESLLKNKFLIIPGAHDAISALLAKKAGFRWNDAIKGAWSRKMSRRDMAKLEFPVIEVDFYS